MIRSDRELRARTSALADFERALAEHRALVVAPSETARHDLEARALVDKIEEIRAEVETYEALRRGDRVSAPLDSLRDLPQILIKARIASGLTQRVLAEQLGVREQQIQRDESTGYAGASFDRLAAVAEALGVRLGQDVMLPARGASFELLRTRMREVGVDEELLLERMLPAPLVAAIREEEERAADRSQVPLLQAAGLLGQIYGWSPHALFGPAPPEPDLTAVGAARFKVPSRAAVRRLTAYAVYAHYLGLLVLRATPHLAPRPVPPDPEVLHRALKGPGDEALFKSALAFAWDHGVAVLPLADRGAFHGACWRVQGRNLVVLKQRTRSCSRWLHDLLHELAHAGAHPEEASRAVIEASESPLERKGSEEELMADRFAGEAALGPRAEEIVQRCVQAARGRVERLKAVVPDVARAAGVPVGVLANHLAFRLSLQGVQWWGAATNLQDQNQRPWRIARDLLLERLDFGLLKGPDRDLLQQALTDPEE